MASFKFKKAFLGYSSTISSQNEKINTKFYIDDYFGGEETSENAEVVMCKKVVEDVTKNENVDLLIGSDLSNQLAITSESMSDIHVPFLGIYNACASYVEGLIIGGSLLNSKIKNIVNLVSSNNLAAERTFRYPIEYGLPRRITETFTATGAVASTITKNETSIKLESATIGKVVDYGIKDSSNMGAVMAPAAADTLIKHLNDTKRKTDYYDIILTGDLGKLGTELFKEILSANDITLTNHLDAGSILITDTNLTKQGASGPVCLPLILVEKVLKNKKYKKILLLGTGALHNTTLVNQKKSIPSICHAVSLEVE